MILVFQAAKNKKGVFQETVNEIRNMEARPGVWAIWGSIDSSDSDWLEVGQCKNIIEELKENIDLIQNSHRGVITEDDYYMARRLLPFSKTFKVYKAVEDRRHAKYRDIAEIYREIKIFILDDSNKDSQELREEIEYKFAVDKGAIYWSAWGKQRRHAKEYLQIRESIDRIC